MQTENDNNNHTPQAIMAIQNKEQYHALLKMQDLVQDYFGDINLVNIQDALFSMMSHVINPAQEPYTLEYVAELHFMQGQLLMMLTKLKTAADQAQITALPCALVN